MLLLIKAWVFSVENYINSFFATRVVGICVEEFVSISMVSISTNSIVSVITNSLVSVSTFGLPILPALILVLSCFSAKVNFQGVALLLNILLLTLVS